MTNRNMLFKLH